MKAPPRVLPFPARPRPAAQVTLWEGSARPAAEALRTQLTADGYQVVQWSSGPAEGFPPHVHIYPELLWVVEGELTVLLPAEDRMLDLASGDRAELPAGMVHGTMAGTEGATYLLATR